VKIKTVYVEDNDDLAETITAIAWNSNNFNEFISKLENSGVDKKVVNQIKMWMW